jgi:hypothetical protein
MEDIEAPATKNYSSWMPIFQPMNIWECQHPGCPTKAVGCGGAHGLIAIGWYVRMGPTIFCPLHRPDRAETHTGGVCFAKELPCPICKADAEATIWQGRIKAAVEQK